MRAAVLLPLAGLLVAGASPPPNLVPSVPLPSFTTRAPAPPPSSPPGFTAAPTPNDDVYAPVTRASKDTSVAPGFFTRHDQYRGEGLSPGSSAQTEQDRRAKPGAGISLSMPLQ